MFLWIVGGAIGIYGATGAIFLLFFSHETFVFGGEDIVIVIALAAMSSGAVLVMFGLRIWRRSRGLQEFCGRISK